MSEKDMYNQLLYYRGVWDVEKDAPKGEGEEMEKMKAAAEFNRERFGTCRGVVEGYLKRCGRVWVQMDGLFGFAMER